MRKIYEFSYGLGYWRIEILLTALSEFMDGD